MAPRLAVQLKEQGYGLDEDEMREVQESADWITYLYLRGVLTKAEASKARHRIGKRLLKAATPAQP